MAAGGVRSAGGIRQSLWRPRTSHTHIQKPTTAVALFLKILLVVNGFKKKTDVFRRLKIVVCE